MASSGSNSNAFQETVEDENHETHVSDTETSSASNYVSARASLSSSISGGATRGPTPELLAARRQAPRRSAEDRFAAELVAHGSIDAVIANAARSLPSFRALPNPSQHGSHFGWGPPKPTVSDIGDHESLGLAPNDTEAHIIAQDLFLATDSFLPNLTTIADTTYTADLANRDTQDFVGPVIYPLPPPREPPTFPANRAYTFAGQWPEAEGRAAAFLDLSDHGVQEGLLRLEYLQLEVRDKGAQGGGWKALVRALDDLHM